MWKKTINILGNLYKQNSNNITMSKIEAVDKKCHSPVCKTVEASFEFVKFGRINTLDETFQAEVTIESKWVFEEDSLEDKYDPKKHWNPQLKIENALAPCNNVKYVLINENNQVVIKEIRKYNGLFWQQLNLRNVILEYLLEVVGLLIFIIFSFNS